MCTDERLRVSMCLLQAPALHKDSHHRGRQSSRTLHLGAEEAEPVPRRWVPSPGLPITWPLSLLSGASVLSQGGYNTRRVLDSIL